VVSAISEKKGWTRSRVDGRNKEIDKVRKGLGIHAEHFYELGFPTAELDQAPMAALVEHFSRVFKHFQPREVFVPHLGDAHSDHRITFDAAAACAKWFRHPSIMRILAYETLSETDVSLDYSRDFRPTVFVDISPYLEKKLELLRIYSSEIGSHPFPRSEIALRSLAQLRGAQAGFQAAEAFALLRERQCGEN
jgi:LmbE family N-acetylglucosaminyl deacetylase